MSLLADLTTALGSGAVLSGQRPANTADRKF